MYICSNLFLFLLLLFFFSLAMENRDELVQQVNELFYVKNESVFKAFGYWYPSCASKEQRVAP